MTVRILTGDVFDRLAELPDESVHCVVSSPPYWGLRDYGVEGAIGLEPTFDEHLEVMVRVFREVRRVLRKDGTLWLNYGDAYAGSTNGRSAADTKALGKDDRTFRDKPFSTVGGVFKAKDLMMMPARVALALQADGWWLRSEIVWHKKNPMPESTTDRPTSAHEKIYLLTKSARYFYDAEVVRTSGEKIKPFRQGHGSSAYVNQPRPQPNSAKILEQGRKPTGWATSPHSHEADPREKRSRPDKQRGHGRRHAGFNDRWDDMPKAEQQANGANLRNVWTAATEPFRGAHFAVMPTAIVEPCIKAGTSEKGCCAECGAPRWPRTRKVSETKGWAPSCECDTTDPVHCDGMKPCTVLDPFAGAGTVGLVADRLGRDAILIELNPEYADMARARIAHDAPLIAEVA